MKSGSPYGIRTRVSALMGLRSLSYKGGGVLHFKFIQDFQKRVIEEVKREEMWNKSMEYKVYLKTIESNERTIFYNQDSLRYESSAQLLRLGFLKSSAEFESFVESKEEKPKGQL